MNPFIPTSPLEVALLEAQKDEASQQAFIRLLMDSEVGVLLDLAPLSDGSWDPEAVPMVLQRPAGFPAIAVFTSPERAIVGGIHSNTYQWGKALPFRILMRGVQPSLGLVMNPGSAVSFDMAPADLAGLKQAFGVETAAKPA